MTTLSKCLTISAPAIGFALGLGLAMTSLASPSFAGPMSAAREQALRECSTGASKYQSGTWQSTQLHTYRSCMMQHGEPE